MAVRGKRNKKNAEELRLQFMNNLLYVSKCLKKEGRYLWGLDVSLTNTGLTIYDLKLKKFKHFSHQLKGVGKNVYARINLLEHQFRNHIKKYPPKLVVMEGYAYGSKQSRELIAEVTYSIKRILCKAKVLALVTPPTTLKKFAVLRGMKVEKKEILEEVRGWGLDVKNHDEADSAVLCFIGLNIIYLSKNRNKILDDLSIKKILSSPPKNFDMKRFEVVTMIIQNDGGNIERFIYV